MTEQRKIKIPAVSIEKIIITIEGISSLISNRFSSDLSGNPKNNTPEKQFEDSIHFTESKKYGYPSRAIQKAIINACRIKQKDVKSYKMTEMRGIFSILSGDKKGLLELDCSDPVVFDRIVYNNSNAIKHRYAKYDDWKITFELIYNSQCKSIDDFLYLLSLAGQFVGLGVLRPQCQDSGEYGRFKIIEVKK